jgi:hypothetical protein
MMNPNAALWQIRREFDQISNRIDRQVLRTRREGCHATRSRRQAVESLRHKRDTLLIRFWLLERHGDASWHNLRGEIEEAWLALKAQWECNSEESPQVAGRSSN